MALCDVGVFGLGVMGSNLALNFADHGYAVGAYDRAEKYREAFAGEAVQRASVADSIEGFVSSLKKPRAILIMVTAGEAVDWCIDSLLPHLSPGDILLDGGNSYYPDTSRRCRSLAEKGVHFMGMGVSGGEEGARHGPALMPGGPPNAWPQVRPMLEAIAAKALDGRPCCAYIGEGGAGHFVKMVHNGIEYADMQLICEAYWLMRQVLGIEPVAQARIFSEWNEGELNSYLIEITAKILAALDEETSLPMVDVILDRAGQKGTGKWTSQEGLDLGTPIPTIAEAVFARCLSAVKEERTNAAQLLAGPKKIFEGDASEFVEQIRIALYASKVCVYAQGFQLMRDAAKEHRWKLDYAAIAAIWRAGCIIRARFLEHIAETFQKDPGAVSLLTAPYFREVLARSQTAWRSVVANSALLGVPAPAFSSALAYYDGYRAAILPAHLLQAQRDYFGAHRFERADAPGGQTFHREWS